MTERTPGYPKEVKDLMDFPSIIACLTERELDELQAAIDERRSRRLAREGEDPQGSAAQPPAAVHRSA